MMKNMNYNKNIKITLPERIDSFIDAEIEKFRIPKNRYFSEMFKNFKFKYTPNSRKNIYTEITVQYQFAVPKEKFSRYEELVKDKINLADYCRDMIENFLSLSNADKEEILLKDKLDIINEAIENKMRLNFTTSHGSDMVEPYAVVKDLKHSKNYVICYRESFDGVVNYSLQNIKKIEKRKDEQEYYYIDLDKAVKSFDPFLSYDKHVKIKITPEGERIFQKRNGIRPEVIKKEGDIWTLESTDIKALIYFSSFYDEVEILEPESLRNFMAERAARLYKIYHKEEDK